LFIIYWTYILVVAFRDWLLLIQPSDTDYVIVGATPEDITEMLDSGAKMVGKDFHVFLINGQEHALARTERALGELGTMRHTDFAVNTSDVTLEEDLGRRDFTMNALAADGNEVIDPYSGIEDIANKIIRHINADAFMEDPLRILRAARFSAQLGFEIHHSTLTLMKKMVTHGALNNLTPERVWKETRKGLMTRHPSKYLRTLDSIGGLEPVFPELYALKGVPQPQEHHPEICTLLHTYMTLDGAAEMGLGIEGRVAALFHDLGKALTPANEWPMHVGHEKNGVSELDKVRDRLKLSNPEYVLSKLVMENHLKVHRCLVTKRPGKLLQLAISIGALKNDSGNLYNDVLMACKADARGRLGYEAAPYHQYELMHEIRWKVLDVSKSKEYREMVNAGLTGGEFKRKLEILRINAVQEVVLKRLGQQESTMAC
jgi:tRNA nucleotidyltransferase (CCA-adding enzyme)